MVALGVVAARLTATAAAAADPTFTIERRIAGPDGGWDYATVDPASRRLFVARNDGVLALDLDLGTVRPKFVPGSQVHGVISVGDTGLAASANGGTSNVTLFQARSGRVVAQIKVGTHPDALVFEPKSGSILTMNGDGSATVVDPAKRAVTGTIAIGGALEFATADGVGLVYDAVEDRNEIAVLDVSQAAVTRRIPLDGCEGPTGLAYDAETGLLIAACRNGVAKVVNAKDGTGVASLPIGKNPDAVILDATHRRAFIPSGGDGSLAVLSIRGTDSVVTAQRLPTQPGTRTGAVDRVTGTVYLPTARFGKPDTPGARPKPLPGSFEILVVGGGG